MNFEIKYSDFLKKNGRSLAEINPGSDEIALAHDDALIFLELLKDNQVAIYGGDILIQVNNKLVYAYQFFGDEFQYLNWYCDKNLEETNQDYLIRSHVLAKEAIERAEKKALEANKKCFIVFIFE